MRILNVTAQKPDSTGSGVYLAELVRCQAEAGHETAVVCGVGIDDSISLPAATSVYPVRFETDELPFPVCGMSDEMPYPSTRYRDLTPSMVQSFEHAFTQALRKADADFQPDVVICHHLYLLTALTRELLPHRAVGAVCHSTDLRQMATHTLEHDRIVQAVRNLEVIFSLHAEQKAQIERMYEVDPSRIQVVGTGYNRAVFSHAARVLDAGPVGEQRCAQLVYVGKIARKKGIMSLIAALNQVDAPADLHMRLVGGAGNEQELDAIREQAKACRYSIELAGRLPQDDLVAAYRSADIFVLPSFYEGLPLVVVEALACGCRVVTTDLPGLRPWIAAHIPDAPITYVELPGLVDVDEPDPQDLPLFEERLAQAITNAIKHPQQFCDTGEVSWERLSARIALIMQQAACVRYTAK